MYVLVNAAMSADGKLSSRRREQIAISGDADFARVDRCRAVADGILIGVGTVLADNPSLLRHDEQYGREQRGTNVSPPARIIADSNCRTPTDSDVLAGDAKTYILTTESASVARRSKLRDAGAELIVAGTDRVDLTEAFTKLGSAGIEQLFVEGGGELIFSLFEAELVDELTVYIGNVIFGGRDAPTLADGDGFVSGFPTLSLRSVEQLDTGVLLSWSVE